MRYAKLTASFIRCHSVYATYDKPDALFSVFIWQ